jgi:N-acetylglucosaminylphosphatidylinositol deacetylase
MPSLLDGSCNYALFFSLQLVTFDHKGISGHINHRSTYHGVKAFAAENPSIPCYGLKTVFILRKFSSILDVSFSWLTTTLANLFSPSEGDGHDEAILVLQPDPLLSHRVMNAHYSQYMWFRKLFVVFSRHNHINTLRRIK